MCTTFATMVPPRDDIAWALLIFAVLLPPAILIWRHFKWQVSLRLPMLLFVIIGPLSLLLTDDLARVHQRLSVQRFEYMALHDAGRPQHFDLAMDGIRYGVVPLVFGGLSLVGTLVVAYAIRYTRTKTGSRCSIP